MIKFNIDTALEQKFLPTWELKYDEDFNPILKSGGEEYLDDYINLYSYLENLYKNSLKLRYQYRYSLDNFMQDWISSNIASDSVYETKLSDDYLGYHYRNFEIDHKKRAIELFIVEGE